MCLTCCARSAFCDFDVLSCETIVKHIVKAHLNMVSDGTFTKESTIYILLKLNLTIRLLAYKQILWINQRGSDCAAHSANTPRDQHLMTDSLTGRRVQHV